MMSNGSRWLMTTALGASIIAVCYGIARYAYGLFVPQLAIEFDLDSTGVGLLGGVSTVGYTFGLLAAPRLAYLSARAATVTAGICAATGLILMSASATVAVFAVGLAVAGSSAGLVSPAVAQLIDRTVRPRVRTQAQTWANTGTSFGLVASACAAMVAIGWRPTWLGFGLAAAAVTVIALFTLPRPSPVELTTAPVRWRRPGLTALLANSVLLGVTSAAYWNFSIERVREAGLGTQAMAWFWLVIGIAGPAGGIAGGLCRRYGLTRINVATWLVWVVALGILALPLGHVVLALTSAAMFGATYMALTGLCIIWAARLFPEVPARGVTHSFLGLGIGQTVGAPVAGLLADRTGLNLVFGVAAFVSLAAAYQLHPRIRLRETADDRPRELTGTGGRTSVPGA